MSSPLLPPTPGLSAPAGAFPPARFAELGEVRLAYHEAGPADGPLVLLCHGFPELAYSWRHQLGALAAAGYRVVAPDLRGFGQSSSPTEVSAYGMGELCGDLACLMDHLGAAQAVLVGHDWGGALVWQMAVRQPQRVRAVASLNTPHPRPAPVDPIEILRKRFGDRMYIVYIQTPAEADAVLDADPARALDYFFRKLAPGSVPAVPRSLALIDAIARHVPADDPRPRVLSEEELAVYVAAYRRTGFTPGLNWYRNISRNWQDSLALDPTVRQPALMVMAEHDAVLPPAAADGMEAWVPQLRKVLVEGSSHWTQQEQPEAVNQALLNWLATL